MCTVKTGTIQKNWTRPLLYIWKSLIDDEWERKTIRRHVEKNGRMFGFSQPLGLLLTIPGKHIQKQGVEILLKADRQVKPYIIKFK